MLESLKNFLLFDLDQINILRSSRISRCRLSNLPLHFHFHGRTTWNIFKRERMLSFYKKLNFSTLVLKVVWAQWMTKLLWNFCSRFLIGSILFEWIFEHVSGATPDWSILMMKFFGASLSFVKRNFEEKNLPNINKALANIEWIWA